MIVSALLLQTQSTTEKFSTIFESCKKIYQYLVRRGGVKMIMKIAPSQVAVLSTIRKLGFKVTESRDGRRVKYDINMDAKRDQKILLGLSYYSNNLTQNLVMDACIGKMLIRNLVYGGISELTMASLIEQTKKVSNLLRFEYLLRDPRGFPETIHHRIRMFEAEKEVIREGDVLRMAPQMQGRISRGGSASFSMTNFMNELGNYIMDTYLIVLIALDGIIQGNHVIKE